MIAVRGEVSNLRTQASGHTYFTLKDSGSQISAVLFRGNASRLSKMPKEGDQLVVRGELSVYAPRGNYQIIIREVEFSGTGQLLQKLHELKIKLKGLGWFDPDQKKPLPQLPKTIGVVTSPTGSVIQDILNILNRRFSGFHLILNPVRVQGPEAAQEIAAAIEEFNTHKLADVLIVGRGGGSLEDLWPFNEEIVAKAIRASEIPVISAVGHETDFTIADFVADVRAPTPSAAAELVSIEKDEHLEQLRKAKSRLVHAIQGHLRTHKKMLESLAKQPPLSSPYTFLAKYLQLLDGVKDDIDESMSFLASQHRLKLNSLERQKEALKPSSQINHLKQRFNTAAKELQRIAGQRIGRKRERLARIREHMTAIDPRNLLKKGYLIAFHEKNDSVILSKKDVAPHEKLRLQLSDGKILVKVEKHDI